MASDWNAFWYTPADPTLLGLIRLLTGADAALHPRRVGTWRWTISSARSSWLSPALVRTLQAGDYTYSFWFVVAGPGDVAGLRDFDAGLHALHGRALDASHVGSVALRRDLIRQPRAGGLVRPRPDQRHAAPCIWRSGPAARRFRSIAGWRFASSGRRRRRSVQAPPPTWPSA